jgi:hypothetical protein
MAEDSVWKPTSEMMEMKLAIPYGISREELVIHSGPHTPANEALAWLIDSGGSGPPGELKRIFLATIMLQYENPSASFDECLGTAIVWERG